MKVTFSLDEETMRKLRELANERDMKMSGVLTRMIRCEHEAAVRLAELPEAVKPENLESTAV